VKKGIRVFVGMLMCMLCMTPVHALNANSTLDSLTVLSQTLSPVFSPTVTQYTLNISNDTQMITIAATAHNKQAVVTGLGSFPIDKDQEVFVITVRFGKKWTTHYTINVVRQPKPLQMTYHGQTLTLVNSFDGVQVPTSFIPTTTMIHNTSALALHNEELNKTICFLKDESGQGAFYYVKDGKVEGLFRSIELNDTTYILVDIPQSLQQRQHFHTKTFTINNQTITGWVYQDGDPHYYQLYLENLKGQKAIYQYDQRDHSLQIYKAVLVDQENHEIFYQVIIGILIVVLVGFRWYFQHFKKVRIAEIKEYYALRQVSILNQKEDSHY
jgi:hypothetical protein